MSRKAVIADDSPVLRRIVSKVLTDAGWEVVAVEDGLAAVQAVFREQPDAAVLDVQMPRVSGYVATRLLKDDWQTRDTPLVLLTSLDAASDRYWGTQSGADRYLTKDFEAHQLVQALEELVSARLEASGGRDLRPDPVTLSDDDVLGMVCDQLDRKLFEAGVTAEVTELAATRSAGVADAVGGVFEVLDRVVDADLVGVLLLEENQALVRVGAECAQQQYGEFLHGAAASLGQQAGRAVDASALEVLLSDPYGDLVDDAEELEDPSMAGMSTFLSMPLRGVGGRLVGVLALSSATPNAFGETAMAALEVVAGPAGVVVDGARLAAARTDGASGGAGAADGPAAQVPAQPQPAEQEVPAVG